MAERTQRKWGASGVSGDVQPRLSPDAREHLELVLKDTGKSVTDLDGFFKALADAIGRFDLHRLMGDKSRPALVRKNLKHAQSAAARLKDALNKLDGNSRLLLREAMLGGIHTLFDRLDEIITPISNAIALSETYPQSGALPAPHRYFLAADVKDAIETHLIGVKPTSTRGEKFVAILEVVIEDATGKPVKTVHELARAVIKHDVKRKHANGLVEYVPPPKPI